MPAQNPKLEPGVWTLITVNDVTALTVSNLGTSPVYLKGAIGAVAPTNALGAVVLDAYDTLLSNVATMAILFPGLGAVTRVYALSDIGGLVSVNHA